MPSSQKPTPEQVTAAVARITAPHLERYFFERLENPEWIEPLRGRGFFEDPPAPERVDGGVRCRLWPQSAYLARMASAAPEQVAAILETLDTKNWLVVRDMLEAARKLPSRLVRPLVPRLGDAVRSHGLWHHLDTLGAIVAQLGHDHYTEVAIDLLSRGFGGVLERDGPGIRQASYPFFEALTESVVPALAPAAPLPLLEVLLRWVRSAASKEHPSMTDSDDLSYLWRPAIEEHEQNRDHDFAGRIVGVARDVSERAIRDAGFGLSALHDVLWRDGSIVGQRLAIYLIGEFGDREHGLAVSTMLNRALFEDHRVKHEYALLMARQFALLNPDQQSQWLSWIDAGPSADPSADLTCHADHENYWRFCRLHWVHEHLNGAHRTFYEKMLAEHGIPELADLNVHFGGARFVAEQSPFTVDELEALGFDAAIEKARSWRPQPARCRFESPSIEGFANTLQQFVATDPARFSVEASKLVGLSAPFIHAFLRAVIGAVKGNTRVDIANVLSLCHWVLSRPVAERTAPMDEAGHILHADWQWCRDTIGELVAATCEARTVGRPSYGVELREPLWAAIEPLLSDKADSSVVRQRGDMDPRVSDWMLFSINSPRGKAMTAIWAYADWLAWHLDPERKDHAQFAGTLDQMPEVRSALEEQLTDETAGFTGRAGFGMRLGLLWWLDKDWLARHASVIFDLRALEVEPQRAFGWAAWNTFLFSTQPHVEFYKLLRNQFGYAVAQAACCDQAGDLRDGPFFHLGQHLMTLYGRGDLGPDAATAWEADQGVIRRLVTQAHVEVRSYAIEFVGISLNDSGGRLPDEVRERFVGLWERYWAQAGSSDARADPNSSVFGWWFCSGAFDPAWSIQQLESFVARCPRAEPDHLIVEHLAATAEADPLRAAKIVDMLVAGDNEGWRIGGWGGDAKKVLAIALKAGGEARRAAEDAIDRLGKRGRNDFGALLKA
jgi:hypothetical protein